MPKPTNKNAPSPQKTSAKGAARNNFAEYDYDKLPGDAARIGAAFRPSLTLAAALEKLELAYRPELSALSVAATRRAKSSKPFNSNPWTGYRASGKGKEWKIEPQLWRLIHYNGAYFLAKHLGANNGFEFWHIEDWPTGEPAIATINADAPIVLPSAPLLTTPTVLPAINTATAPVVTLHMSGGAPPAELPDNWEDL